MTDNNKLPEKSKGDTEQYYHWWTGVFLRRKNSVQTKLLNTAHNLCTTARYATDVLRLSYSDYFKRTNQKKESLDVGDDSNIPTDKEAKLATLQKKPNLKIDVINHQSCRFIPHVIASPVNTMSGSEVQRYLSPNNDPMAHLQQLLGCPLCTEQFDYDLHRPFALHCQHVFCTACLQELLRRCSVFRCPLCRALVVANKIDDFNPSYVHLELLDFSKKVILWPQQHEELE